MSSFLLLLFVYFFLSAFASVHFFFIRLCGSQVSPSRPKPTLLLLFLLFVFVRTTVSYRVPALLSFPFSFISLVHSCGVTLHPLSLFTSLPAVVLPGSPGSPPPPSKTELEGASATSAARRGICVDVDGVPARSYSEA